MDRTTRNGDCRTALRRTELGTKKLISIKCLIYRRPRLIA